MSESANTSERASQFHEQARLEELLKWYIDDEDHLSLKNALDIAKVVHEDQSYGDEKYLIHVLRVAAVAVDKKLPKEVVFACLLHDTVEDSQKSDRPLTVAHVTSLFGNAVALGVEHATILPSEKQAGIHKSEKAKQSKIGHLVKLCDALVNLDKSRMELMTFTYTSTDNSSKIDAIHRHFEENQETVAVLRFDEPTIKMVQNEILLLNQAA